MNRPFSITDEPAMWRVQPEDDHFAFAGLVKPWKMPIQRLCARLTGDLHRAEDLAQEAFPRGFTKRHAYESAAKFSTWLWRIAINLCHDDLRRRQRRPESPLETEAEGASPFAGVEFAAESPTPAVAVAALQQSERVRRALMKLPEH